MSRTNLTVPMSVKIPFQHTPPVPNGSLNSNNSSVPIRGEDIEKPQPNETDNKPIEPLKPKTALENDLSWVETHPNWVYMKEPLNGPCGESMSTDRIIGGTTAALGQYPWIARLGRYKIFRGERSQYFFQ